MLFARRPAACRRSAPWRGAIAASVGGAASSAAWSARPSRRARSSSVGSGAGRAPRRGAADRPRLCAPRRARSRQRVDRVALREQRRIDDRARRSRACVASPRRRRADRVRRCSALSSSSAARACASDGAAMSGRSAKACEFAPQRVEPRELAATCAARAASARARGRSPRAGPSGRSLARARGERVRFRGLQRVRRDDGVAQPPIGLVVRVEREIERLLPRAPRREQRVRLVAQLIAQSRQRAEPGRTRRERLGEAAARLQQRLAALAQALAR